MATEFDWMGAHIRKTLEPVLGRHSYYSVKVMMYPTRGIRSALLVTVVLFVTVTSQDVCLEVQTCVRNGGETCDRTTEECPPCIAVSSNQTTCFSTVGGSCSLTEQDCTGIDFMASTPSPSETDSEIESEDTQTEPNDEETDFFSGTLPLVVLITSVTIIVVITVIVVRGLLRQNRLAKDKEKEEDDEEAQPSSARTSSTISGVASSPGSVDVYESIALTSLFTAVESPMTENGSGTPLGSASSLVAVMNFVGTPIMEPPTSPRKALNETVAADHHDELSTPPLPEIYVRERSPPDTRSTCAGSDEFDLRSMLSGSLPSINFEDDMFLDDEELVVHHV